MHPLNQQTSKRTTLALLLMAWFFALALAIPKMMVYKFTIVYDSAYGLKPYCMTKDLEMEWPSFLENLMTSNSTLNSTELISTLKSDSILEWFWLCSFILKSKDFLVCTTVASDININQICFPGPKLTQLAIKVSRGKCGFIYLTYTTQIIR